MPNVSGGEAADPNRAINAAEEARFVKCVEAFRPFLLKGEVEEVEGIVRIEPLAQDFDFPGLPGVTISIEEETILESGGLPKRLQHEVLTSEVERGKECLLVTAEIFRVSDDEPPYYDQTISRASRRPDGRVEFHTIVSPDKQEAIASHTWEGMLEYINKRRQFVEQTGIDEHRLTLEHYEKVIFLLKKLFKAKTGQELDLDERT